MVLLTLLLEKYGLNSVNVCFVLFKSDNVKMGNGGYVVNLQREVFAL